VPRTIRKPLSRELRHRVWLKTEGRCWYCGESVYPNKETTCYLQRQHVDHLDPVSCGGLDVLENLVLSCLGCNRDKSARNLEEFRKLVGESWAKWHEHSLADIELARRVSGIDVGHALEAATRDYIAFCSRANFLFYGERLLVGQVIDYQI
jgi:hypothetical protein